MMIYVRLKHCLRLVSLLSLSLLAVMTLCLCFPFSSVSVVSAAEEGWYLEGAPVIEQSQYKDFDNMAYYDMKTSATDGITSGTLGLGTAFGTMSWSGKIGGTVTGTMTWTSPPTYMQPGSKINFTMTAKDDGIWLRDLPDRLSDGWMKVDGSTIVAANSLTAPTATGTYAVKTGQPGSKSTLWVTAGVATLHVYVGYNYVWQSAPAFTPPTSTVAPAPTTTSKPTSSPTPAPTQGTGVTVLPTPPFGTPEPVTGQSGMILQAGQRHIPAGALVEVPVWLVNANNLANVNFELTYNAGVAKPEGTISKGSSLDNALFSANPNESGIIRMGFAQTTGITGTGSVAYIPFRAVGQPGQRTPLTISVTKINNPGGGLLPISIIHGEIVILTTGGGLPGDCDGDGRLTALDALCALEMSVKLRPENLALDIDTDRQVTSRDTVVILQRTFIR